MSAGHELKPLPLWQTGVALSGAIAIFGAWAWLEKAGVWSLTVTSKSAGFILFAALSVILQVASNFAAAAARRARSFGLRRSFQWAVGLMSMGGAYNAFSFHSALEVCGMLGPDADGMLQFVLILISVGVAGYEPALYWIDEALRAETDERAKLAAAAEDKRIIEEAEARAHGRGGRDAGVDVGERPRPKLVEIAQVNSVIAGAVALLVGQGVAADQAHALLSVHETRVAQNHPDASQRVAETVAETLLRHNHPMRHVERVLLNGPEGVGSLTYRQLRNIRRALASEAADEAADLADAPDVPLGRVIDAPMRYSDVPLEGMRAHA